MERAWIFEMLPKEIIFQAKVGKAFAVLTVMIGSSHYCRASTLIWCGVPRTCLQTFGGQDVEFENHQS